MNNKDLIKQYIDTGLEIPQYQYEQLNQNDLKTYGRKRVIAHNQHADIKYSPYHLDGSELKYLKTNLKDLPEIDKKPFKIDKDSYAYYIDVFPELLDNIPDDVIQNFPNLSVYKAYNYLLLKPELIKYFKGRIDEFMDYQILDILEHNPQLYPYFRNKIKSIKYFDVKYLIDRQPKLLKPMLKDGFIDSYTLEDILNNNPDLYKVLPDDYFKDFDRWDLQSALKRNPDLVKNKNFINKFLSLDSYDKTNLVQIAPELINYVDEDDIDLSGEDAEEIIANNPKLVKNIINKVKYPNIIISKHPEYYKYLTPENKSKISRYTIMDMLTQNPKYIKDIKEFMPEFDLYDMISMVKDQPKLVNHFLEMYGDKLSSQDIEYLKYYAEKGKK